MKYEYLRFLTMLLLAGAAFGQTTVDLQSQSKNSDFSGFSVTRPAQVGSVLPASCQVGQLFFKSNAPVGANLYGCTSVNVWTEMGGGTGSSGSTGVTMATQLGDLQVIRSSANTLAMGQNCSSATPCNVRFGSTVYSIATGATATINSGSGAGLIYIYISNTGVLTVGHNLNVTCSTGCTAQAGVTAFPADSVPLATWSVTAGTLDATGGRDLRAVLGNKVVSAGTGIIAADAGGNAQVSIDSTIVGLRVAAPASSSAACQTGNWASDASYYYVCVASNSWRRAALASW